MNRDWEALATHRATLDPARCGDPAFHLTLDGLELDFRRQLIDAAALDKLRHLLLARGFEAQREQLFAGEPVNNTEGRAALHMALRAGPGAYAVSDAVLAERERCLALDVSGFRDIVHIGIGGSQLGPELLVDALPKMGGTRQSVHFVANADGVALARVLGACTPEHTLFIVASKTFTTPETLLNATTARAWLVDALGEGAVARHFIAVTAAPQAAIEFGVSPEQVFSLWDWVGGRYSVWSAVGLPAMIALGREAWLEFLAGAQSIDDHFRAAPLATNLPVTMGLLAVWQRNFVGATTHAVLPYAESLRRLPAYLQQLVMESLGKRVDRDGRPVAHATAPVLWGATGTNGQHAFHQMLHQGTDAVAVDFIGFREPMAEPVHHHQMLLANLYAQADALWQGHETGDPHRDCPGGRSSSVLMFDRLNPYSLGQLLALYEHQVFVQAVMWNLNPFDQFGVEYGKRLAQR